MVGDVSLEELVDEAREGMDMPVAWVAGMDRDYQTFLAGSAGGQRGDVTGLMCPREQSQCQHTIASGEDRFHSKLNMGKNEHFDTAPMPALIQQGLVAPDSECSHLWNAVGTIQAGSFDPATKIAANGSKTATLGGTANFFDNLYGQPESTYASVPIKVDGQTVATFCVVDRKNRDKGDVDWQKLESLADRAASILKKRQKQRQQASGPAEVVTLTEGNFKAVALDATRNVVVLLHTSWCTHCPKMVHLWNVLAAAQPLASDSAAAASPALVFATFDMTDDDPPESHASWHSAHVPSVVLAPKGGGAPIAYAGALDGASVAAFLRERCPEFATPTDPAEETASPAKKSALKQREKRSFADETRVVDVGSDSVHGSTALVASSPQRDALLAPSPGKWGSELGAGISEPQTLQNKN